MVIRLLATRGVADDTEEYLYLAESIAIEPMMSFCTTVREDFSDINAKTWPG